MVKDIVCGMGVEERDPGTCVKIYQGEKFYFCSPECLLLFNKEPLFFIERRNVGRKMVKDLVCGMEVDEENSPFTSRYKGRIFYFCSRSCKLEFEHNPERFIDK